MLTLKVQIGTEKTSFKAGGAELTEEQAWYKAEVVTESDFSPSLILGKNPVDFSLRKETAHKVFSQDGKERREKEHNYTKQRSVGKSLNSKNEHWELSSPNYKVKSRVSRKTWLTL